MYRELAYLFALLISEEACGEELATEIKQKLLR